MIFLYENKRAIGRAKNEIVFLLDRKELKGYNKLWKYGIISEMTGETVARKGQEFCRKKRQNDKKERICR